MAIYTLGVEDTVVEKHGIVRTSNLKATRAGHIFDGVCTDADIDNGSSVVLGDHITAGGRECVKVSPAAATDPMVLVATVVKLYDDSTEGKRAEWNFTNKAGVPMKCYEVVPHDHFGVSTNMFTALVTANKAPAENEYVIVDGAGKYKAVADAPDAGTNAFLGKVYGYDLGDNETIVLIDVIRNG